MNKETILNFIKKGESETVEFKSTLDQAAIETLAAFANTKGGYVFVGVADSGKITGVQLGNETIPQWLNQIKTNTLPTLIPDVATATIDQKKRRDLDGRRVSDQARKLPGEISEKRQEC
jgi:ATP-dependent DNA helicase RecG